MTFKIFTDTGESYGPYGSLPLAQKHARAKFFENKKIEAIELRPSISSATGGYGPSHRLSFYRYRRDQLE